MAALLTCAAGASAQTIDYDDDDDGLIDVRSLVQLYAIRWDLNGNGAADNAGDATSYANAFPTPATGMGCPAAGCSGYELRRNLDFDTDGDGDVDADDPNSYANFGTIGGTFACGNASGCGKSRNSTKAVWPDGRKAAWPGERRNASGYAGWPSDASTPLPQTRSTACSRPRTSGRSCDRQHSRGWRVSR